MEAIAIVRDYAQLHAALRARAEALNVSREAIDYASGLQSGYTSKLLAPVPMKGLGAVSMAALLGALGLQLAIIEDEEAMRAPAFTGMKQREKPRPAGLLSTDSEFDLRNYFSQLARQGGIARSASLSPERRSAIARKAGEASARTRRADARARRHV